MYNLLRKGEKKEDNWFWGQEKGQGQVNDAKNSPILK